jgi:chemotaxis protein methyltransferase CheR
MDDLAYNYVKRQIHKLAGINLNDYKRPQMERRLQAYLERSVYTNWPQLFRTISSDSKAISHLRDYLTINVSSFFRDPEKYKSLQKNILPKLLAKRSSLRLWSAGCSRGQEIYSMAILLTEMSGNLAQHRLLATDIDQSAIKWAKSGGPYTAEDVAYVSHSQKLQYFTKHENKFWVNDSLRYSVLFNQHNLLSDPVAGKFDLIICRNVVIYFELETKITLYQHFYDLLRPGGYLFVGGTEVIPKASNIGFESPYLSFYQRPK